jgi:hypothetical protein
MNEREYFETLVKIFELVWEDDDLMEQDTLFTLQDYVGDALIKIAEGKWSSELIEKFPWAFSKPE